MKLKTLSLGILTAASMCGSTALANFFPPNGGQAQPPYESLIQAKQLVQSVAFRVAATIQKSAGNQGGEGGLPSGGWPQPGRGSEFPQPGESARYPQPSPNFPSYPSFVSEENSAAANIDRDVGEEELENDQLANFALMAMGRELFELGQLVDQATMNYNAPAFWSYWTQACFKTGKLIVANQGAKTSANLPIPGLISPSDFEPNDYELNAVRQQLWCH